MSDLPTPRPRSAAGPDIVGTASVALAVFLLLMAVLATQLRNDPRSVGLAAQKPRVVVVRRIYETIVHERTVGATGTGTGTPATVSSSSASVPRSPLPAAPVATRTS